MKRIFDFFWALVGLVLLLPLFLLIGLAIKLTSPGAIFFRQTRVGRFGKLFKIYKFRTMIEDAPLQGLALTMPGDSRVTNVGRLLRSSKIDELPQLINVLKGEMSFVGPRPEVPEFVALYNKEQMGVLSVRPGITDAASILFANEERVLSESKNPLEHYKNEVMPRKLRMNLEYVRSPSLTKDVRLILKTIVALFSRFLNDSDKVTQRK